MQQLSVFYLVKIMLIYAIIKGLSLVLTGGLAAPPVLASCVPVLGYGPPSRKAWSQAWQSTYRDGADAAPAAGAEVPLPPGGHVQQDEHVSRHEDERVLIQRLQVPPAPAVVTKQVAARRTQKRRTNWFQQVSGVGSLTAVGSATPPPRGLMVTSKN